MESAGEETKEQEEKVEKGEEVQKEEEPVVKQENGNNYSQTYPYYQYPPPVVDPYSPYPPTPSANGYYPPIPPGPSALDSLLAFQPPDAGDLKVAEIKSEATEIDDAPEKPPEKQTKGNKRKVPTEDESTKKEEEKKEKDKKKKKSQDDVKILNIRKNIRDVIEENQLDANTLAAQRQESERLARVQEQQKVIREIQKQIHNNRAQQKLSGLLSGSVAPHGTAPSESGGSNASGSDSILRSNLSSSSSNNTYIVKGVAQEVKFSGCSFVELDQEESSTASVDSAKEQEMPQSRHSRSSSPIFIQQISPPPTITKEIVTISDTEESGSEPDTSAPPPDDDDDDDCIVLSDDDEDQGKDDDDPHNSGLHVNDAFNIPDEKGRVVVNIGHLETEEDIYVAPQLSSILKPHQIGGIRFLFDNIIESVARFKQSTGFGCILAHSMGLGKTLQIVTFCDIFLRNTDSKHVLVIMPINTLQNWVAEFEKWLPTQRADDFFPELPEVQLRTFRVFVLNDQQKTLAARSKIVMEWHREGGVLLMGYEMFRLIAMKMGSVKKKKSPATKNGVPQNEPKVSDNHKKLLEQLYIALVQPGPDLVICDEGHRIKNSHASISVALKQIQTKRRVVLTGYPLQNNLLEYWCMVDFVRPNYLGTKTEFSNMFERPINNGQCIDSTPHDIKFMRYRAHVLHSLLVGFVQRRSHMVLQKTLPNKQEYVILVRLSKYQRKLYEVFMNDVVRKKTVPNPLKAFAVCCKIWNHPDVLYNFLKTQDLDLDLDVEEANTPTKNKATPKEEPILEKVEEKAEENSTWSSGNYYDNFHQVNYMGTGTVPVPVIPSSSSLATQSEPETPTKPTSPPETPQKNGRESQISYEWAKDLIKGYVPDLIENSPKMEIFFCLLEESVKVQDRILVFSQSLLTLNLIERFLQMHCVPGSEDKWKKHKSYFRIDGATPAVEREKMINEFNKNAGIHLFLVSTKAGSLGINLIGANRVIIFDASWNPCHDTQAVCRIYRYGQQKPCFIYRIVMDNCLEKKIYDRQINKQGMADRVVDECNPDAHLSQKEITNLCYDYEEPSVESLDFSSCLEKFTDDVVKTLIRNFGKHLSREPFCHESLLVDRKEKKLSSAEKRIAQRSYELAKKAATKPMINYGVRPMTVGSAGVINGVNRNYVPPMRSLGPRPNRWIPAEVWQRQGMTAQEMMLPLDVVIPTSSGEKSTLLLKAGQKVMVLKSQKGVYMQLETGKIIAIRTTKGRGGLFGAPTNNSPSTSSSGPGSTKPESDGDDDDCILVSDNPPENQPITTSENIPPATSTVTTASGSETTTKSVYAEKTNDNNCVPATAASEDTYNTQRQMQSQTAQTDPQQSHLKKSMPNIRNIPAPYPSINYQAQQNEGKSSDQQPTAQQPQQQPPPQAQQPTPQQTPTQQYQQPQEVAPPAYHDPSPYYSQHSNYRYPPHNDMHSSPYDPYYNPPPPYYDDAHAKSYYSDSASKQYQNYMYSSFDRPPPPAAADYIPPSSYSGTSHIPPQANPYGSSADPMYSHHIPPHTYHPPPPSSSTATSPYRPHWSG
ncbi:RAD54L2 family protein [Megaselia abdita]